MMSFQRSIIYISYVFLGISTTLYGYSLRKDLQKFDLSVQEIQILETIPLLPWVYKCLYAYYSEKIPICGSHQKYYLIMMNFLSALLCCALIEPRKNYQELLVILFFQQSCAVWADVNLDSMKIVESNRDIIEEPGSNGRFNARVQIARTIGYWVGDSCAPVLWHQITSNGVYGVLSLAYFFPMVMGFFLTERPLHEKPQKGCMKNIRYIWKGFNHPVLGRLLIFVLMTGIFIPSASTPVFFFLNDVVELTPEKQSLLNFIAHGIELLSLLSFDKWIRKWSLKKMYVLFSFLQIFVILFLLLLVLEVPGTTCEHPSENGTFHNASCYYYEYAHLDPFGLALGENVLGESIDELIRLPLITVTTQLCSGPLGATLFTSIYALQNICNGIFARAWNSQVIAFLGIDHFKFQNLPVLVIMGASGWLISSIVAAFMIPSTTFTEIENDRINRKFASTIKEEFQLPPTIIATAAASVVPSQTTSSESTAML